VSFVALPEVAIQHNVRRLPEVAFPEVHQEESEVIENVAGRYGVVELDRIEKCRLPI
jgi:hypothetical protein